MSSETDLQRPQDGEFQVSKRYANYVLGVLFCVYIFNFIDRYILIVLLDPIKEDLGISDTAMGFLTGFAFALFYTFAGIPIARWADHGARRTVIAVGLTVWSAMTAVSGAAQSFVHLALARIGVGIGEAAGSPPAHSLISDYFPIERRTTALSIYNSGMTVGVMIGMLAGGWINELFNWRVAFLVVGLPGLLMALVVRFGIREPPRGYSERGPVDARSYPLREVARFLFSLRSFCYYSLGGGLTAFASYGFDAWVPAFLGRVHGMGSGEIGTWIGIMAGVAGTIGFILGGVITDRLVVRDMRWYVWVPAFASTLSIPFIVLFLLLPNRLFALFCYLPAVILWTMFLGPIIAISHRLVTLRMRALSSALLFFVLNIVGLGMGPQTVGLLNDHVFNHLGDEAVRYSILTVLGGNVLAAVCFILAGRRLPEDLNASVRRAEAR